MAEHDKSTAEHVELTEPTNLEAQPAIPDKAYYDGERAPEARGRDVSEVSKGYWYSPRFLGSMAAIGLGFCGGTGGYALIAPVLTDINNDLGPSPNITCKSSTRVVRFDDV